MQIENIRNSSIVAGSSVNFSIQDGIANGVILSFVSDPRALTCIVSARLRGEDGNLQIINSLSIAELSAISDKRIGTDCDQVQATTGALKLFPVYIDLGMIDFSNNELDFEIKNTSESAVPVTVTRVFNEEMTERVLIYDVTQNLTETFEDVKEAYLIGAFTITSEASIQVKDSETENNFNMKDAFAVDSVMGLQEYLLASEKAINIYESTDSIADDVYFNIPTAPANTKLLVIRENVSSKRANLQINNARMRKAKKIQRMSIKRPDKLKALKSTSRITNTAIRAITG